MLSTSKRPRPAPHAPELLRLCVDRRLLSTLLQAASRGVVLQVHYRGAMEFVFRPKHMPFEYVHSPEKGWETREVSQDHVGTKWQFNMDDEVKLGLAPAEWSTTSQMNDPRPLGKSLFDARFVNSPMGRARGGYSMHVDARGIAQTKGQTAKAENMDSNWFANDMADETAAGNQSAMTNQYGQNTNLSSFSDSSLALAQMSLLQKKQMDKDGDGKLSDDELRAHGFDTDLIPGN